MWLLIALTSLAHAGKQPSKRPTDEARGQELYERHCFACHGTGARGDGPATAALREEVPPARGFKVEPALDVVLKGRALMPAFGDTFERPDARRVLQYMLKLPDAPTEPKEAAEPESDDED